MPARELVLRLDSQWTGEDNKGMAAESDSPDFQFEEKLRRHETEFEEAQEVILKHRN